MSEDILDKVMKRYGLIGVLAVAISVCVLFVSWLFASYHYPPAFFAPILAAGWMLWRVTGGKDE